MSLRPNARTEVRKKAYKVAVDADEARRKREDNMVEIRKSKREESLLKKRKEGMPPQQLSSSSQPSTTEKKAGFIVFCLSVKVCCFATAEPHMGCLMMWKILCQDLHEPWVIVPVEIHWS